ncbi:MAG: PcfJ domain-containing protein [Armatimonadetes bacterium]|nr:PcfJ domain-containing protein [Armatimonadota bacterium]
MSHAYTKSVRPGDASQPPATVSTAGPDLRRHLRALGLDTAEAYRAWCRQHGFGEALTKTWQERRAERQAAEKARQEEKARAAQETHWRALGLGSAAEYEAWCRARGLHATAHRSQAQRRKEREMAAGERAGAALAGARQQHRRPEYALQALHDGTADVGALKTPYLQNIAATFAATPDPGVRDALLRLLLCAHRRAGLLRLEPAFPHLGPQPGNTFIEGLAALARHHRDWRQAPEDWRPDSHNAHRQFGALARHLLARYAVPAFFDAAWCEGDTPEGDTHRAWFIHIGQGRNIRTAPGLPLALSKRAAHLLPSAPAALPIEAALRWAQVKALGGDESLIRALLGTRLGHTFGHEEFWTSVLHFFLNHPMLDPACVGPMVDYIHHVKFVPRDDTGQPAEPDLSMKGRSPLALGRRVDEWHRELARETRRPPLEWAPSGIGGFRSPPAPDEEGEAWVWTVTELRTAAELTAEGKAMHHCVGSYARSCAKGQKSIWSLGVEDARTGLRRRVLTVEVHNARRLVVQARGRCNKAPGDRRASARLGAAPHWLAQWARQEGLTVATYV